MAGGKESLYYDEAERLYKAGHTLEKVRELLPEPVSLATLSRWSQKGDWPAQRKAAMSCLRNVPNILLDALVEEIVNLRAKGSLDATAFDAICKTTAAIERLRRMLRQESGTVQYPSPEQQESPITPEDEDATRRRLVAEVDRLLGVK